MKKTILLCIVWICYFNSTYSQNNKVTIDFTTQKFIGDQSILKREKYFAMHESFTTRGLASQSEYLFDDLGIEFGRGFNGPSPLRNSKSKVPSINHAKQKARKRAMYWKNAPMFKKYATRDFIITDHPRDAFQPGVDYDKIATYNANYIKNAYPILPKYYEIMNEPFVHAKDYVSTWDETHAIRLEMSKMHKVIADKIHAEIPGIMVGGYSAAWPEVDRKGFEHWETRMKLFMDIAGERMDFFATHIYDGRNVTGDFNFRSGSNSEGILDLIETYSYKKWGVVKPHLISEYGYTAKGLVGKPHSNKLHGSCLKSYNSLLMGFLNKPDRLLKAIPFIAGESNWFYKDKRNPDKHAYPWAMIRKAKDGSKVYTDLIKFYELWKDVNGKRIDITSNNPDIQAHAFVNDKKAYISLNNLDNLEQKVSLDFINNGLENIEKITIRRLFTTKEGIPKLQYSTNTNSIKELLLKVGETVILESDLKNILSHKNVLREYNYYSKTYLQKITAQKAIPFIIEKVNPGAKGRATIKMGIGRAHQLSKQPIVSINGKTVKVPNNWAGYDQANREQFFGVINIPVDIKDLAPNDNRIEITFPDSGGHVSSVILRLEKF